MSGPDLVDEEANSSAKASHQGMLQNGRVLALIVPHFLLASLLKLIEQNNK